MNAEGHERRGGEGVTDETRFHVQVPSHLRGSCFAQPKGEGIDDLWQN